MLKFDANSFLFLSGESLRLAAHLSATASDDDLWRLENVRTNDANILEPHIRLLMDMGFDMSSIQLNRIVQRCRDENPLSHSEMSTLSRELALRIQDESNLFSFFNLSRKEAEYFNDSEKLFGDDFALKFPSEGTFELNEAAKCYALGRSTACVFHLMRVMELGIKALSQCLGIPDPIKPSNRNWSLMLKAIKEDGIDQKWPNQAAKMAAGAEILESLYVSLDAVRNPWRNATMHVENKYTQEEAEHIFIAVKGFMKKLSTRMDEKGEPKA